MNKLKFAATVFTLLAFAAPALAQYPYAYRGTGMGAGMWFVGFISFVIGSFIFSWIFWMVGKWMMMRILTDRESWKMGHEAGKREEINKEMGRENESWKMGREAGKREEISKEMNRQQTQR